jgi:hypothetical protein
MLFYNALKSHGITRLALIPFVMIQRVLTIYVLLGMTILARSEPTRPDPPRPERVFGEVTGRLRVI